MKFKFKQPNDFCETYVAAQNEWPWMKGQLDLWCCLIRFNILASFLDDVSSRTQAGVCQLTHLTQQANTTLSLKYLAELSMVILKLFQIITRIHYQTSTKFIRKLKCNEKGTFMVVYSRFVIAFKMHDR